MWFNIRNEATSTLVRHWDDWLTFTRECFLNGILSIHKIGTDDELADLGSKALPKGDEKFRRFRNKLLNVNK